MHICAIENGPSVLPGLIIGRPKVDFSYQPLEARCADGVFSQDPKTVDDLRAL